MYRKMKYTIIAVACLFGAVQAGVMTPEQEAKMLGFHKDCLKESNVDEAIALKAKNGEYTDDDKLKKHLFCVNKKAGIQNEAGDFQIDFIKSKVNGVIKDESITNDIVGQCAVKKSTPEETAYEALKCFHQFAPKGE